MKLLLKVDYEKWLAMPVNAHGDYGTGGGVARLLDHLATTQMVKKIGGKYRAVEREELEMVLVPDKLVEQPTPRDELAEAEAEVERWKGIAVTQSRKTDEAKAEVEKLRAAQQAGQAKEKFPF